MYLPKLCPTSSLMFIRSISRTKTMITLHCKRIAIIGAGPSGLAAAKYLTAEKTFETIDVYEQRAEAGGIWKHTPDLTSDDQFKVPQTSPFGSLEKPAWKSGVSQLPKGAVQDSRKYSKDPEFLSPIYDRLETNIPRSLMRFSDHAFPDKCQLFPKHEEVEEYLKSYAKEVRHLIKFCTQISDIRLAPPTSNNATDVNKSSDKWVITSLSLPDSEQSEEIYDAVILANGHFAVPYVPDIPGIKEWGKTYPGSITHAKYYRRPQPYQGKKVIVVGNSASGLDIGTQIASICAQPLLMSSKSASYLAAGFPGLESKLDVPPISSFNVKTKTVHFEDGREERDVDAIVFCTGYFYSFPFLPGLQDSPYPLIKTGKRVCNTYKHLFYAPHPTLSLLALNQKIIPFPIAEAQSAVLARVYSGRLPLPSFDDMRAWEESVLEQLGEKGEGNFHELQFPRDAEYINELCDWAASAKGEGGKTAQRWGAWHYWARERFPQIRRAFVERGEERHKVRDLEEIGFDFEKYLEEKRREGKEL